MQQSKVQASISVSLSVALKISLTWQVILLKITLCAHLIGTSAKPLFLKVLAALKSSTSSKRLT